MAVLNSLIKVILDKGGDVLSLMYPVNCRGCGNRLSKGEETLCLLCIHELPRTRFENMRNNSMEKHFWGRVPLSAATAFCYFQKGGKVQHLMHQFKYKRKTDIGLKLGQLLGEEIKPVFEFQNCDCIIPIPLHWKKQKKRGYNQSDFIADGISEALKIPVLKTAVQRNSMNESQTRKNRFQRWQNVESIFSVAKADQLKNKNVLLVDDVMTTGSTLEACASEILKSNATSVSVATLALAER